MEELKVPVEKIDLGKLLKVRKVVPPVNMGVALGLSLRDIAKDVPGVNLCKSHELKAKMGEVKLESVKLTPEVQKSIKQAIAVAAVVLVGLHIFMYRNTNTERAKLDQVLMARPQVALAVSSLSYEEIESAKLQMDKKLLNLSKIIDRRIFWTEKLNELPKLLPPGVWLVELAIIDEVAQAKTLMVKGIAYHEDPVQEIGLITKLVANMRANQAFSRGLNDVTLGPMTSQDLQGMTAKSFSIYCVQR
jgi:Tfp pilus assembly protein PilN